MATLSKSTTSLLNRSTVTRISRFGSTDQPNAAPVRLAEPTSTVSSPRKYLAWRSCRSQRAPLRSANTPYTSKSLTPAAISEGRHLVMQTGSTLASAESNSRSKGPAFIKGATSSSSLRALWLRESSASPGVGLSDTASDRLVGTVRRTFPTRGANLELPLAYCQEKLHLQIGPMP